MKKILGKLSLPKPQDAVPWLGVPIHFVFSMGFLHFYKQWDMNVLKIFEQLGHLLSMDFSDLLPTFTNTNFLIFIALFPLCFATVACFASRLNNKAEAFTFGGLCAALTYFPGFFFFTTLNYTIVGFFYGIGVILAAAEAYSVTNESGEFRKFGLGFSASKKIMTLLAFGVFIALFINVSSNLDAYKEKTIDLSVEMMSEYTGRMTISPSQTFEAQFRSRETRAMFIQLINSTSRTLLNSMSQGNAIDDSIEAILTEEAINTMLQNSLKGTLLEGIDTSAASRAITPTIQQQASQAIKNYFHDNTEAVADQLVNQVNSSYDTMIDNVIDELNETKQEGMKELIESQGREMIQKMFFEGEMGSMFDQLYPIIFPLTIVPMISFGETLVLSPLAGIFSIILNMILNILYPIRFMKIIRRVKGREKDLEEEEIEQLSQRKINKEKILQDLSKKKQ